jgi:hypothetical protein
MQGEWEDEEVVTGTTHRHIEMILHNVLEILSANCEVHAKRV